MLKLVPSDEFAPSIDFDTDPIDCADEGVKPSAFHCASASVLSDTLEIVPPVCCVMAVGSLITRASANLRPRHRSRNDDMIGAV